MKKVWKLTALSLLALTISVGHAFLCYPVKAATDVPQSSTRLVFSFETNAMGIDPVYEVYLNCDIIFSSNALTSGQIYFTYTPMSGNRIGYGMIDGSGTIGVSESGTSPKTITVQFTNTTYFVYRFQIRGDASKFTQNVLNHPVGAFNISFGSQNLTYGDVIYSEAYQMNMMNYYLQSIASSQLTIVAATENIDDTLQDILDEVQQINQSLSQQQQDQVDDVLDKNDDLNNLISDSNTIEQSINDQFNSNKTGFNNQWQSDQSILNFWLNQWSQTFYNIKTEFEGFYNDCAYYLPFIVLPVFIALFKRLMGG